MGDPVPAWTSERLLALSVFRWTSPFVLSRYQKQDGWHLSSLTTVKDGVELDFTPQGKATDNSFIKALSGRFRRQCLNENWFLSLEDAAEKVESWRRHYNGEMPYSALGNLPPREFCRVGSNG